MHFYEDFAFVSYLGYVFERDFSFIPYSGLHFNPNSLWWVHMGISLKESQITEEPIKEKIWKK